MAEQNRLHKARIPVTHALGPYLIICEGLLLMHSAVQHFKQSVAPCSQRCHQSHPDPSKCWRHLMVNITSTTFSPYSKQHNSLSFHCYICTYKHIQIHIYVCRCPQVYTYAHPHICVCVQVCTCALWHVCIYPSSNSEK